MLGRVETLLPGAVAIWFAAAAAVVGALLLVVPVPWQLQLVLFGALVDRGAVPVAALRRGSHPETSDQPRAQPARRQYIGQVCALIEADQRRYGKARVGDSVWKVRGPDLPAGASVRVTGADGAVLTVEAAGGKAA